jgi:hypothetical protein
MVLLRFFFLPLARRLLFALPLPASGIRAPQY